MFCERIGQKFRERETAVWGEGEAASFSCSLARIMGPNWDTLPAPRVKIMSPGRAAATARATPSAKELAYSGRLSLLGDSARQSFAGDALDRRFAGGINVEDGQRVGILKCGGELVHEIAGAGVAMRLEYDVDFAEAALPRGRKRGTNLGGMMAVVINHADARGLASQLEPAIHAAEVLESDADVVGADVETDSDRDGCGRIQDVMHSGHVQTEFAEVSVLRRSHEND